jgi:bacillolysin
MLVNMTRNFFALLLFSFSILSSVNIYAQKGPSSKHFERFIKEDGKTPSRQAQAIFKKHFTTGNDDELVPVGSETDNLGFVHERFQQFYKKIKVEGAVYTIHSKNNLIQSLSGEFKGIQGLNSTPSLSASNALEKALAHINAKIYAWEEAVAKGYPGYQKPAGELVIVGGGDADSFEPKLAWKFDIYAADPLYRAWIYVDARNGKILFENHRIHNTNAPSSGTTLFNGTRNFTADFTGTVYRLRQTSSGNGIETYSLNNGTSYTAATDVTSSSSSFTTDPTANQAHWGAEQTYDYFKSKFNRNSYDNAGAIIKSYVHYSTSYVNAFWDGSRMTYGDGDANYKPLVSLDICGHEITHAVTEKSANLIYSYESGALNESFSDIFGEAIENYAKGTNDWLMSCDIGANGCGAFRSMSNPNQFGDPDTYKGTNWHTASSDNGGVHINSGVQNKWFYILTTGESGTNDIGNTYNVIGIGIDKAASIAYRNLTVYLSASSGFAQSRAGAIQAAIDLYGAGSPEVIATTNAWHAVGIGCNYDGSVCPPVLYCSSQGNSQADEWIGNVQIGSFSNASGASPYTFFSSKTISLNIGQPHSFTLTPAFSLLSYSEYWRIWIDYNGDKDFDDAGELVYDAGSASSSARTGSFTVPSTATGTTRMRISMKYNAAPTTCEAFSFGEVEDYPVTFVIPAGDREAPTAPVLSSPSKTNTSISLSWTAASDNVGVTGYDVFVNDVKNNTSNITATSYTITGLTASTTYSIYVKAKDAAGNNTNSNTLSVTTNAPPPCPAPTGLSASSSTGATATLTWAAVSGASSYKVEYKKSSDLNYITAASANTTRSVSLTGLSAITSYDWRVTTTCSGTIGGATTASFHTVDGYEANNTASVAKIISLGSNILGSIHNSTDQDWYKFTISKSATAKNLRIVLSNMPADYDLNLYNSATSTTPIGTKVISGTGTGRTVTITHNNKATTNITYHLKVNGSSTAFSSSSSYRLLASASSVAYPFSEYFFSGRIHNGPVEETKKNNMTVYPVPARDVITLRYHAVSTGKVDIQLVDLSGRILKTQRNDVAIGENVLYVNVSSTSSGIFVVKTIQGDLINNAKIEIIK